MDIADSNIVYANPNAEPYQIETTTVPAPPNSVITDKPIVFERGKVEFADHAFHASVSEDGELRFTQELNNAELTERINKLESEVALLRARIEAHNAGSPWRI